MRCYYKCDGCGKTVPDEPPADWLYWNGYTKEEWPNIARNDKGPWVGGVVACSADCVSAAKEDCKRRARASVERFCARVDAAHLERVNS